MIAHQISFYFILLLLLQSILVISLVSAEHSNKTEAKEDSNRDSKLLNVFSVVKFPNEACNSTGGNYYGTCYTATECASLGQ